MKRTYICVSLLALAGWARAEPARALPDYPEYLQTAASAPCLPHCNVCHRDDNAGSGTVDRPFALSMERIGGLGGGGSSDVARALDVLRAQKTDSDGDGVADNDELSRGEDPNFAGDGDLCGPQVGCSTSAPFGPWSGAPALLALLAIPLLRRFRAR
ncbi:MAG: hypothetical protein RLZZ450_6791 [Pseudomonadota bacterium]|jgi:hypothetical protein